MTHLFIKDPRVVSFIGIVAIIGYVSDTVFFYMSEGTVYLNYFTTGLTVISLLYFWIKKPSIEVALSSFIIILMFNLMVAPYLELTHTNFGAFYMRNSLIFWVIMPILGLIISKPVFATCLIFYLIQFTSVIFLSNDPFLRESAITLICVFTGYVYVIFFLLKTLDQSYEARDSLITELKKNNQLLNQQSDELSALVSTKDKLFSIIAHDLQSPFMGISGLSEMIKTAAKRRELDQVEEYSSLISQTTTRTSNLLSNLLEWATTQSGKLEINVSVLDLDRYVNESIDLLSEHKKSKEIHIRKKNTNIQIQADAKGLLTILRNLISNALKFTPAGGLIVIEGHNHEHEVVVSVSDTGVGIKPAQKELLFSNDNFQSTRGTNEEQGTGIGLGLCHELVQLHNGKIWVESEVGKGSTFYISLPKVYHSPD